jgi:hypothetical protein
MKVEFPTTEQNTQALVLAKPSPCESTSVHLKCGLAIDSIVDVSPTMLFESYRSLQIPRGPPKATWLQT